MTGPNAQPPPRSPVQDGEIRGKCPHDLSDLPAVKATRPAELPALMAAARAAQAEWAKLSVRERGRVLARVRERFLAAAEEVADTLYKENGKPRAEAYTSEIVPNAALWDYWIPRAPKLLKPRRVRVSALQYGPGKRGLIELLPRGVVALISPWNYPVSIPLRTLVPALLAGNAVLFKPSEYAALSGRLLCELFAAELPAGLVACVQGGGEVGQALIEAGPDLMVFTGSVATGKKVALAAAERLIPVSLELGGKDAAVVLEDADVERTANGLVWGAFANAGQNCASIERVFVTQAIAEPLMKAIEQRVARLRTGPGADGEVDVGPLTNERQLAIVADQLDEARSQAQVRGGEAGPGLYLRPALVRTDGRPLKLMQEETFGPVLPVVVVKDEAEAVARANDSPYGLTASVWTRDLHRGAALGRRLKAGVVTVNNHSFTATLPAAPWSGVEASGYGITNSPLALHELCRPRFVLLDKGRGSRELWWYPYDAALLEIGRAMTQLLRKGVRGKIAALGRLLKGFFARMKLGG